MMFLPPEAGAWIRDIGMLLLPSFIALIALMITIRIQRGNAKIQRANAEVAATRLKLDLFDKRYDFLQLIRNITTISLANDERYFEKVHREYARFTQSKLLFPAAIAQQVDAIIQTCDELWVSSENVKKLDSSTTEGERERRTNAELRGRIRQDMIALQKRVEDFIRVDWNG